jgi:hypothetical protein
MRIAHVFSQLLVLCLEARPHTKIEHVAATVSFGF